VRSDPCRALYGNGAGPGLPVAVFTDSACPNCRTLEATLAQLGQGRPGTLAVVRHQLPLLGPASVTAARAVLAASLQDRGDALWQRLTRSRALADRVTIARIAEGVGIDPERLIADMASSAVDRALADSAALAGLFGFYGTPGTVIGRTAFLGALPAAYLTRIVVEEGNLPPLGCNAT
jgi:predicted DsbA family dithiol-disulfide isomerase